MGFELAAPPAASGVVDASASRGGRDVLKAGPAEQLGSAELREAGGAAVSGGWVDGSCVRRLELQSGGKGWVAARPAQAACHADSSARTRDVNLYNSHDDKCLRYISMVKFVLICVA